MKNFKNYLHILLTFASLLGFLGGWATLAHSGKPLQPDSKQSGALAPLPALEPIPAIGSSSTNSNNGLLTINPATRNSRRASPFFTTSGS